MAQVSNIQHDMPEDIFIKSSSKNLDEAGLVMLFNDLFGINSRDKFPNDFDTWSVKKRCDWINQNITEFFPNTPQSLSSFFPAMFCQLDNNRSPEKLPEWMDMDKYRKGQKFVHDHYYSVIMSILIGLTYSFTFDEGLRSMILGEHSHTPYLGFQKYISSLKRILNWCNGDPWIKGTEAYKDMQVTRKKHLAIREKVCQMSHEQITAACTFANPWCPDRELLLKDFAAACPPEKFQQRPYLLIYKSLNKPKGINNADFAMVQSCFTVLPLLYPQSVGIYDATDEDLEAYSHMWKCYGYFLGMEDEYNMCRGSLEDIKQRLSDIYQYWVIHNFKELTPEWEHITRCLIMTLNYFPVIYMSFKAVILIATDALKLNMPHLYSSLSYTEWFAYKIYKLIFYGLKFSRVRTIVNRVMWYIVDKTANYNVEKLTEIHEKSKKILPDFSLMYE